MLRFERTKRLAFFEGMTPGLVAGVIFYVVTILFIYFESQRSNTDLKPCLVWQLIDIPCPLCRGTTASLTLLTGDFVQAWILNPLVAISLIIVATWAILWIGFGIRMRSGLPNQLGLICLLLLLAINWVYLLVDLK